MISNSRRINDIISCSTVLILLPRTRNDISSLPFVIRLLDVNLSGSVSISEKSWGNAGDWVVLIGYTDETILELEVVSVYV